MWYVIETAWNCTVGRGWDTLLAEFPSKAEAEAFAATLPPSRNITILSIPEYNALYEEWLETTRR